MKLRYLALPFLLATALGLGPLTALGRSEGAIQKTWDYPEGIHTLTIEADRQDVVLKAGGPRLSGRLVGDSGDVMRASRNGDAVTITVRTDRSWFSWRKKTARIEVSLPPGMAVDISTASGAVVVEVATAGLRVRSASGDIEAPRGGTSADADTASGTVRLKGFTGPVRASALSGDLILEGMTGDIQASTLSGDLSGTDLFPSDKSRFSTVSGDASLELRGGPSAYQIKAETVSGDIHIGDISGSKSLTAGTGPSVAVQSVSGDVRVR